MLRAILEQAPLVEISLCCDSVYDRTGGTGLFSKTQRTAGKLEKLAKDCGASVKTPVFAENENDQRPEAIIDLEENFLQTPSPTIYAPHAGLPLWEQSLYLTCSPICRMPERTRQVFWLLSSFVCFNLKDLQTYNKI